MQNGGLCTRGITKASTPERPLITVVTVVSNGEKTLEQTIQSVVNQTYANVEYIIIDGASTDGTLDIIKKYEDKIDYWQSEPDKGIYDAMNKGIGLATGEWINFMNAGDCFCNKNVLSNIFIMRNVSIFDIVYGNPIDSNGKSIKQYAPTKLNLFLARMVCHQAIFAKKTCFIENLFNCKYKLIADRVWLHNLVKQKTKIKSLNINIVVYDCTGVSQNYNAVFNEVLTFQKNEFGYFGIVILYFIAFVSKIKKYILSFVK